MTTINPYQYSVEVDVLLASTSVFPLDWNLSESNGALIAYLASGSCRRFGI